MKRLAAVFMAVVMATTVAAAQSSGNFSTTYFPEACAINQSVNGGAVTFTGGACIQNSYAAGDECKVLDAGITTSNGNGVTLLITPSAVTGLYTDTKVSNTTTTSTARIGIQVCVKVDGKADDVKGGDADGCAIFDERLQQVSQNFLGAVASVATCELIAGVNTCYLDFLQATLSAHSYNFVAQVPGGQHNVTATWSISNVKEYGDGHVGACVGPGNVTVTQTKVFKNSGDILQQ